MIKVFSWEKNVHSSPTKPFLQSIRWKKHPKSAAYPLNYPSQYKGIIDPFEILSVNKITGVTSVHKKQFLKIVIAYLKFFSDIIGKFDPKFFGKT